MKIALSENWLVWKIKNLDTLVGSHQLDIYILEYQSGSHNIMEELELVGSHNFCENRPTLLKTTYSGF
jgi:hypothetical protein